MAWQRNKLTCQPWRACGQLQQGDERVRPSRPPHPVATQHPLQQQQTFSAVLKGGKGADNAQVLASYCTVLEALLYVQCVLAQRTDRPNAGVRDDYGELGCWIHTNLHICGCQTHTKLKRGLLLTTNQPGRTPVVEHSCGSLGIPGGDVQPLLPRPSPSWSSSSPPPPPLSLLLNTPWPR
jgi:hypothetical protein